ncbi:MAG: hypothetical protein VX986_03365 [Pseudomonadota bacterium]|nr:hypothetical protein [Pseudomonadota bacterium]
MLIIRQVALAVGDIKAAEKFLVKCLGLRVCYRDPELGAFGLVNIILPIGNQFLEVVSPIERGSTASRFLEKNGDGGYMVITQCDDHAVYKRRVEKLGIRIAHEFEIDNFLDMQLHPKDTGGSFLEIDQQLGSRSDEHDGPWSPVAEMDVRAFASPEPMTVTSVCMVSKNPTICVKTWSDILGRKYVDRESDFLLDLDNSSIIFSKKENIAHDKMISVGLNVEDKQQVIARAEKLGARCSPEGFFALGINWILSNI